MIGPLCLPIHGDLYVLKRVYPEAAEFKLCWTMLREGSEMRTVMVKDGKTTCDCESFVMRMQSLGLPCKHIESLTQEGLLPKGRP